MDRNDLQKEYLISFDEFVKAYYDCRKNKRNKESAIEFEMNWQFNLFQLYKEVNERTYVISDSITFVTTRPKKREVFAASFRDRIVHHLVCSRIEPLFEAYFIHDTYNCRAGKGTDYGVRRLHQRIQEVSENYTRDCYVAKFDMQGFFMSINRSILWEMLDKFLKERYDGSDKELILWLVKMIVLHDPENHCIRKMPKYMWHDIPANKSLFTNGEGYGLPIGNLTSQMFANFYLTEFDKWMSERFVYGRYVDDFYVIDYDKRKILKSIPEMRKQLAKVEVKLHPNKVYIQHYSKGISFIGGVVKNDRIYSGNRTVDNFKMAILKINEIQDKQEQAEHTVQVINSYLGFLKHRRTYNIRQRIMRMLDQSWYKYLYIVGEYEKVKLKVEYTQRFIVRNTIIKMRSKSKRKRIIL